MIDLSTYLRRQRWFLVVSAFARRWRPTASLATAYCFSVLSYLAVKYALSRPRLDPIFEWLGSRISPDFSVWNMRRIGWPYHDPFVDIELDLRQIVLLVTLLGCLLLLGHLVIFAIVDPAYRWRGKPQYWSEFCGQRETRRQIALDTLRASAWRSSFAFPLAGGIGAVWCGVSRATYLSNPALLIPQSQALLLSCVAVLLIYLFVTSAMLRRNVVRQVVATGPLCAECGYMLRHQSPRCPECGSSNSMDSPPAFGMRGSRLLRASLWSWSRLLIVGSLLFAPLLLPVIGGVVLKIIQ